MQYFLTLRCFSGTFSSANNLIPQKNMLWKADEIIEAGERQQAIPGEKPIN